MKVKNESIRVNLINSHPGSPCIEKSEKIHKDNLMPIDKIEKKLNKFSQPRLTRLTHDSRYEIWITL
jgi:hypothetical protein